MMNADDNLKVVLMGLPGCGLSGLLSSWQKQFPDAAVDSLSLGQSIIASGIYGWSHIDNGMIAFPVMQANVHYACVIDVRSSPKDLCWLPGVEELLLAQLQLADSIILNFSEQSDLIQQSEWSAWFKQHNLNGLPIIRVMNQLWPQNVRTVFAKTQNHHEASSHAWLGESIDCLQFDLSPVVFDHLLMALDNSRHSLAMPILRVTASLDTLEYTNRVRLEGSACRFDSYAASESEQETYLKIYGLQLDDRWFQQLVDAARC